MWDSFVDWSQASGIKVLSILLVAWLFNQFGLMAIKKIIHSVMKPDKYASQREEKLRENTIVGLVSTVLHLLVWVLAILIVLTELNVNIGPLIAGAGVIGFAIGFGAQSLVKDFIAGIFIVLENQYRVGDVVDLDGVGGKVQRITMRSTVLRDLNGNLHHIPNGTVSRSTNKTMEYARINLTIGVSYKSDIEKVKKVINAVGLELSKDEEWKDQIIEAPYFVRISDFAESAVKIKIFGKVLPAKQWAITGELRRRIKMAFDKNKIEIPFPQRVIHNAK
jgi:small conductance mechanosensitive channel